VLAHDVLAPYPGVEERFQRSPDLRAALRVTTIVCGLALIADALLRLLAALLLPVSQAATAVTALTVATVVIMIGWLRFYVPHRAQTGERRSGGAADRPADAG
jgi:hypothetical protein